MLTSSYLCIPYPSERQISEQEWNDSIPLDAPRVIPSGSFIQYENPNEPGAFIPLPGCVSREQP